VQQAGKNMAKGVRTAMFWKATAFLLGAFILRLAFGLCSGFWRADELHTYLIGLKFYTTGDWPTFGPDVVFSGTQIPGALQGLLVGLPLYAVPVPESPVFFLNLLSLGGLCLLAWYCRKRCPKVPAWFVWIWLLLAPWTLNISTHVVNTSYLLCASIVFFVAVLETYPALTLNVIKPRTAYALMGVSLLWICQLHLSWVLLIPYVIVSFWFQAKHSWARFRDCLLSFAAGALVTGSLLIPTFLSYGLQSTGNTESAIQFNPANLSKFFHILARFLSFASYELPRFMGWGAKEQLSFLMDYPWVIPFALLVGIVGLLQPAALLVCWFKKNNRPDWKAMKRLVLYTVLLIYVSFLFADRGPKSHTFYVVLPIAMIYSFYCWERFLHRAGWRRFAAVFLAAALMVGLALSINNLSKESLYQNRPLVKQGIDEKNYHVVGERRPGSYY